MTPTMTTGMSLESFCDALADELALERSNLDPHATLDELGFDSLTMVEILFVVESAGVSIDLEKLDAGSTLAELHDRYIGGSEQPSVPFTSYGERPSLLEGVHAAIRPVDDGDYEWLYRLCRSEAGTYFWRFRGMTPSLETFKALMNDSMLAQMLITRRGSDEPKGLVTAYNPNLHSQWVYMGVIVDPSVHRAGWPLEGVGLFVDYLFSMFDLRKLYFENFEHADLAYASAFDKYLTEEARLEQHAYIGGRYVDARVSSLWRRDWEEIRDEVTRLRPDGDVDEDASSAPASDV